MPEAATSEKRVTDLELAVEALKHAKVDRPAASSVIRGRKGWLKAISGSIQDVEAFDDALRLGREICNTPTPGPES